MCSVQTSDGVGKRSHRRKDDVLAVNLQIKHVKHVKGNILKSLLNQPSNLRRYYQKKVPISLITSVNFPLHQNPIRKMLDSEDELCTQDAMP